MNKTNKKEGEMFVRGELVKCNSHTRIKLKLELKCTNQMAKKITIWVIPFGRSRGFHDVEVEVEL